ncbi:hypothetical protein PWT90_02511 [Aphanocladium album]|nr:hypothetical protein PWT90_02511 [Aphanocladium album]
MVHAPDVPLELLEKIFQATTSIGDVGALLRTCRTFYRFNDHFLYRHRRKRNRALAYAIEHGIEETFTKVREWPGTKMGLGQILWACRYGRLEMLKTILAVPGMMAQLERFSDEHQYVTGYSPLYMASRYGQVDVVEHLLTLPVTGAHRHSGHQGLSPLHGALEGDCQDNPVIPLLLTAAPNLLDQVGYWGDFHDAPFKFAIRRGNAGGLRRLLEAGAKQTGKALAGLLLAAVKAKKNALAMSEALLEHGAPASGVLGPYEKPLACALQLGRDELVLLLLLLRRGPDLRSGSVRGASALEMALINCRLETCRQFVELVGIFPDIETSRPGLLRAAAQSGDADKLKWVLDDSVFQRNEEGQTAAWKKQAELDAALARAGSRDVVALLVSIGADPNHMSSRGPVFDTILQDREIKGTVRADALRGLLENGADLSGSEDRLREHFLALTRGFQRGALAPVVGDAGVQMTVSEKQKLLFESVWGFDKHLISIPYMKFLVGWGADVNAVNWSGHSILYEAMHQNHYRHLDALLDLDADARFVNNAGNTLLHVIRVDQGGHEVRAASRLLALGLDPNAVNNLGFTPLDTALRLGSPALIELHVRHGADVTAARPVGRRRLQQQQHPDQQVSASTMHLATMLQHPGRRADARALRTLIRLGADVDARDGQRRTPLHWARSRGSWARTSTRGMCMGTRRAR